jgi:hypothetical protein
MPLQLAKQQPLLMIQLVRPQLLLIPPSVIGILISKQVYTRMNVTYPAPQCQQNGWLKGINGVI